MRETWCDGLEGYLMGGSDWPDYMNDGTGQSLGMRLAPGVDSSPLTKEDRIYFAAGDAHVTQAMPSWAVAEIMKALGDGRRVRIYAGSMEYIAALCDAVGMPLVDWKPDGPTSTGKPS